MRAKKAVAVIAIIVLAIGGGLWYKFGRQTSDVIKATGTIEVTRADAGAKVGGYLSELTVKTGDKVEREQVIARVVRADLAAQMARDEAALARAEAQLRDLEAGARAQERSSLMAAVDSARAVKERAEADFERYRILREQGAISAQQLDTARVNLQVASAALTSAAEQLSLSDAGARPETIAAQRLEVERSRAVVVAAKAVLADTVVKSPISGLVLTKNYEDGEFVNAGAAVVTVGDMQDAWVKVYIPSTHLGRVKVGQAAEVRVDSYPERAFKGSVREIAQRAEFTPRQSITPDERANMVFAVKIGLENNEGILKPGMPADVVLP